MDIEIRDVNINSLNVPEVPEWLMDPPQALPPEVPVTQQIGIPIIDIPGCVEAHEQADEKNQSITGDDPKGVRVYCDGNVPSFNPLNYEPDQIVPIRPPAVKTEQPDNEVQAPPASEVPKKVEKPVTIQCPTREQELKNPVGKILEGNKKITGYELVGKECLMVTEQLSIPDQIISNIPNPGMVTTTASIAIVATTSALLAKPLADLLLKVVKPTVKKVIKKVASIRGKKTPVESLRDRRQAQRVRSHAIRKLKGKE